MAGADVIIGLQWGDEGKGKISYFLCRGADAVARFQGGANAGHTVLLNGRRFKFNMLPAGCLAGAKPVIAAGCVLDLDAFKREVNLLRELGLHQNPLVSKAVHVILPIHRERDIQLETLRGASAIGTTQKGIGPAYADKMLRVGVRARDLTDREQLMKKITFLQKLHSKMFGFDFERTAELVAPFLGDVEDYLNDVIDSGGRVVLEGAQGVLLDIDHGTYPYVTSSNTVAAAGCVSAGIPVTKVRRIVGVMKAYTTRVGAGPFPTELTDTTAERIREKGGEYGTTTGRPRRIGWLDIPAIKHAVRLNGVQEITVTKVDVLSDLPTIKACERYMVDGHETDRFSEALDFIEEVKPILVEFKGWSAGQEEWVKAVKGGWDNLPDTLREYLEWVEKKVDAKISLVSVGEEAGMVVRRE